MMNATKAARTAPTPQASKDSATRSTGRWIVLALMAAAYCVPRSAHAAPPPATVTASVEPAEIRPGAFTTYTITIENGAPEGAPDLKLPEGLEPTTSAPAFGQQTTIDNGSMRQASTLTWQISCNKVGEYVIPSQKVTVRGRRVDTDPVRLVVKENPAYPVSKYDPLLTLEVDKREFYLGEVVPVTVNLYVHRKTFLRRVGLIELPKESFAVQRFPLQGDESTITMGGVPYRALAYHSTLSGLKPGKFTLGPASSEVIIEVPSDDTRMLHPFFNQTEPRKVRPTCNDIEVTVLPLPKEGMPKDFNNLVGDFQISLTAEPHEVNVNDPISVDMIVSGTGNFDAVSVPAITDVNSWKVYPARRYNVQSSDNTSDGAPRSIGFSQVIIPKKKVDAIPPFELSYFSPQKKQYVTLRTNAVPIAVKAVETVEAAPIIKAVPVDEKALQESTADKVPQVKPRVTDILAMVPENPRWLAMRPAPWADRRFVTANAIAAGVLALLLFGKLGLVAWRAHANSPLAPTRHLWGKMNRAHLSRSRFYALAATYISARGLTGPSVQEVLERHSAVNYGPPTGEAEEQIPHEERRKVLAALQAEA
jgi:hypothetical protein